MTKIGFCCKWIDEAPVDTKTSKALTASMNQKTTTQKYMRGLAKSDQYEKIKELVTHNCETLWRQLAWLAKQPEQMRMFRVTSEFLPLRTLDFFDWIYDSEEIDTAITDGLRGARKYADANGIRLTMHPGQFTNLCSDKAHVVTASIKDFEHHADIARRMGYGDSWHSSGFAINVHANVRQDPGLKNIRRIIANDFSDVARNLITLENDEYSCSVDDFYNCGAHEDVALILDLHHHWIATKGRYISKANAKAIAFRDSWRGMRPLGHVSMPQQEVIPASPSKDFLAPNYAALVAIKGISSSTLRAHSSRMWNFELGINATEHLYLMDLEVEAKDKNVASRELYQLAYKQGVFGW